MGNNMMSSYKEGVFTFKGKTYQYRKLDNKKEKPCNFCSVKEQCDKGEDGYLMLCGCEWTTEPWYLIEINNG